LCGAAVAFKLAQALLERLRANGSREAFERLLVSFLKVVAISTVADAVPLTGENRAIAAIGLDALRDPRGVGLRALVGAAGVDLSRTPTAGDIAFRVAPRLNAAGRMDVARDVVDLLSTRDAAQAAQLAAKLSQLNSDRQQEEQKILAAISEQMQDAPERYLLVIAGDGWHRGVIGIAATRVVERYNRPALVISRDESGEAHGSGRSIRSFHLLQALESCADLFTRFGGHAHAVGFSLPGERVPQLATQLEHCARARLSPADLEPVLDIHAELEFCEITPWLYEELCRLEPFGMANPQPRFVIRRARVLASPKLLKEKHLKLKLGAAANGGKFVRGFDAVGWRMAAQHASTALGDTVDVVFTLDENTHPEFGALQLNIADLRHSAAAQASAIESAAHAAQP
jgi:single-stranded-DNA-specific exonuclease